MWFGSLFWNWFDVQGLLLYASALLYAASLFPVLLGRERRPLTPPRAAERLLGLAIACHIAFTICRSWVAERPPFFGTFELLSWFALCCGMLSLYGHRRFGSKFVITAGVSCAFAITLILAVSHNGTILPGFAALRDIWTWWYGFATPIGYAAGFLAFAAQLRSIFSVGRTARPGSAFAFEAGEEDMNWLALSLVRFCYPFLLSGLLTFTIDSLDSVGRAWFWQRSIEAQLFTLVAYSIYLHLWSSTPLRRGRIILAQFAAFSGLLVSVLSFELPRGLLNGLGLDFFL